MKLPRNKYHDCHFNSEDNNNHHLNNYYKNYTYQNFIMKTNFSKKRE